MRMRKNFKIILRSDANAKNLKKILRSDAKFCEFSHNAIFRKMRIFACEFFAKCDFQQNAIFRMRIFAKCDFRKMRFSQNANFRMRIFRKMRISNAIFACEFLKAIIACKNWLRRDPKLVTPCHGVRGQKTFEKKIEKFISKNLTIRQF